MMDGLVFVIDSSDRDHIQAAKNELRQRIKEVWSHNGRRQTHPTLILANKQDLPKAMSAAEIIDGLDLNNICGSNWYALWSSS